MLTKLATLVQSKVALAVLGAALVAGGGTAAMVVAHSHSSAAGDHTAASTHTPSDAEGNHAHSVSIEGTLKGYDSGAGTISVLEQHDKTATTVCVDSKTEVNGAHASKLSDLKAAVGQKVQVQATKQSSGSCSLLAWKVTVTGADGDQGNGNGDNGQNGQKSIDGAVTSVGSGSFAIKLSDGTTETVTVSAQTRFDGRAHNLAGLKTGDKVVVQGTDKGGGVFAATSVEVTGAD